MENTFYMLLFRTFHAQRNYMRACLAELGIGFGQPKLMNYLDAHGPCKQRAMAEYFEIDRAAVSRMLDSLEKKGLVACRSDRENRRADLVELTEKGRAVIATWRKRCGEMEAKLLSGFSEAERQQFSAFLSRAYSNLRNADDEEV